MWTDIVKCVDRQEGPELNPQLNPSVRHFHLISSIFITGLIFKAITYYIKQFLKSSRAPMRHSNKLKKSLSFKSPQKRTPSTITEILRTQNIPKYRGYSI